MRGGGGKGDEDERRLGITKTKKEKRKRRKRRGEKVRKDKRGRWGETRRQYILRWFKGGHDEMGKSKEEKRGEETQGGE